MCAVIEHEQWVAELGQLSDPGLVPLAIAAAIGLSDAGESLERLAAALFSAGVILGAPRRENSAASAAPAREESIFHGILL